MEDGELPEDSWVPKLELPYIFWANFFGPEYVAKLGREFLSNAPGWRLVDFPDGSVLYVTRASFHEWREDYDYDDVLDYFRTKFPAIEVYRAVPWWFT